MTNSRIPMPVVLHPRLSKIATSPTDYFIRMNLYASRISNLLKDPEFKLTLMVGLASSDLPANLNIDCPNLRVIRVSDSTRRFNFFASQSIRSLTDKNVYPNVLIAGDTSFGLLSCFRARKISRMPTPIQISIHGSFYVRPSNLVTFAKSRIRIALLRLSLKYVESIRVVSTQVENEMINSFRVDPRKIFIAPIPFETYPQFKFREFQTISLGVIGRLHSERNLDEILVILDNALSHDNVCNVFFLGSGPLEKNLKKWQSKNSQFQKINLLGSISHIKVLEHLSDIDIVLSAAESEGYGLAIREAILSGAIVLARRNAGTEQILKSFQSGIYLYDTTVEANEIIKNLLSGVEKPTQCSEGRKIQESIDDMSISRICESWTAI